MTTHAQFRAQIEKLKPQISEIRHELDKSVEFHEGFLDCQEQIIDILDADPLTPPPDLRTLASETADRLWEFADGGNVAGPRDFDWIILQLLGEVADVQRISDAVSRECQQLERDREYNAGLVAERDAMIARVRAFVQSQDFQDLLSRYRSAPVIGSHALEVAEAWEAIEAALLKQLDADP